MMSKPFELNVDKPGTMDGPLSVMGPKALIIMVPEAVSPGRLIGALSKSRVRLRRLVRPVRLVVAGKITGTWAPAFTLRKPTSRMLATVPANTGASVPRLLACVCNRISDKGDVTANVDCPLTLTTPLWVIDPPVVTLSTCAVVAGKFTPAGDVLLIVNTPKGFVAPAGPVGPVKVTAPLPVFTVRFRAVALKESRLAPKLTALFVVAKVVFALRVTASL